MNFKGLSNGVVKVGEGRGFVVNYRHEYPPFNGKRMFVDERVVITASHCLPFFPPSHPCSYSEERTYENLLGPLDVASRDVWAECLFVGPIADIAVLGGPDSQSYDEQNDAYLAFLVNVTAFKISEPAPEGRVWLLGLDGEWFSVSMENPFSRGLWLEGTSKNQGGMSGSPIRADDGSAIGIVCVGSQTTDKEGVIPPATSGPHAALAYHLPGWFLRDSAAQNGDAQQE